VPNSGTSGSRTPIHPASIRSPNGVVYGCIRMTMIGDRTSGDGWPWSPGLGCSASRFVFVRRN
jgi:hypothetical protein